MTFYFLNIWLNNHKYLVSQFQKDFILQFMFLIHIFHFSPLRFLVKDKINFLKSKVKEERYLTLLWVSVWERKKSGQIICSWNCWSSETRGWRLRMLTKVEGRCGTLQVFVNAAHSSRGIGVCPRWHSECSPYPNLCERLCSGRLVAHIREFEDCIPGTQLVSGAPCRFPAPLCCICMLHHLSYVVITDIFLTYFAYICQFFPDI